ncbi:MAG TPA: sarcosine oxidase subunit gamma family protein [Mesorhizobium sp.]|jgi:sarcosine oxidase subunit gamma|nr:sarcosine oxidase subunit gamma family protein [Mesorhizobium sp.]
MADLGVTARRGGPLGEELGLIARGVQLSLLPPADRVSLRAPADSIHDLNVALSIGLPRRPKTSSSENGLSALWLGPDEWLLIGETRDLMAELRPVQALHSAVDISHRNVAIAVTGEKAAECLSGACPQNLNDDVFPVGAATRTVLGKVEIVLWRDGEQAFRVECWRSFAPYAFALLSASARDAAA